MEVKDVTPAILGASFELAREGKPITPDTLVARIDLCHKVPVSQADILSFLKDPKNIWLEACVHNDVLHRRKANGDLVVPPRPTQLSNRSNLLSRPWDY